MTCQGEEGKGGQREEGRRKREQIGDREWGGGKEGQMVGAKG